METILVAYEDVFRLGELTAIIPLLHEAFRDSAHCFRAELLGDGTVMLLALGLVAGIFRLHRAISCKIPDTTACH